MPRGVVSEPKTAHIEMPPRDPARLRSRRPAARRSIGFGRRVLAARRSDANLLHVSANERLLCGGFVTRGAVPRVVLRSVTPALPIGATARDSDDAKLVNLAG